VILIISKELLKAIKSGDVRKFYKSTAWRHKRQEILQRDNYECQRCKREGKFSPASIVHHIKHLTDYPELALADDNLISVCAACHNKEHPEKFEKFREQWNSREEPITPERW